jgi:predicted extracellular nuclease
LLVVGLAVLAVFSGGATAVASSSGVVISQIYGGGGNTGATLTHDFIELYNAGSAPVSLDGWSVQYASQGGTTWQVTPLSGSIGAGRYYLVRQAQGTGGTTALPNPDASGSVPMSAVAGKVALVRNTTSVAGTGCPLPSGVIEDYVGYGTPVSGGGGANCFEGAGAAPTLSNATAAIRAANGCTDTDNNGADFSEGAPNPRNSQTTPHFCSAENAPSVSSTIPPNSATGVARNANVTITFSEAVNAADGWYTISCSSSGSHTATQSGGTLSFTLDPATDFAFSETCTVTVFAANVTDQDALDPPDTMEANHVFSFTTENPPILQIHDVQGAGHVSPFVNQLVSGVEGVVTVKRPGSFWIQDATPDASPATSEGILVFGSAAAAQVAVGDEVLVNGRVTEFRGSPVRPNDLTLTEITSPSVTVVSHNGTVPSPVVIGMGGVMPPTEVIDDDTTGSVETGPTTFDPANDGIDFWETFEGMLLQVNNGAVVNETESFGEITLLPDNGVWATGLRTPHGGILARSDYGDFNPERFTVDDEILRDQITPRPANAMPAMNVGDRIIGSIVGPLDYSFSNFKIQALATPTFFSSNLQPETTQAPVDQEVTFATFNVENLSVSPANAANEAKFDRLAGMIVNNLRSPDLIGIEEVQDDNATTNNGVVDATQTWTKLVAEIQQAGGPLYQFTQINPVNNEDGGAPGGNIRVGFLYRTDRGLSFVSRPGGDSTTATQVVSTPSGPQLSFSPGRVDPENDAWFETRKPLAGEFRARGKKVFVVVNHFSSKTDDQPLMGHHQPPQRLSEVPDEEGLGGRHAQAAVVHDFVADILAADPAANVIVLGDINDFEFSETVDVLEGGGALFSAIKSLPANERYSYVFEGNSQVLDQILLSPNLNEGFPYTYDVVHANSEFAGQASDHEPSLVRIDLTGRPTPKP